MQLESGEGGIWVKAQQGEGESQRSGGGESGPGRGDRRLGAWLV